MQSKAGCSALFIAATNGHSSCVAHLLDEKADPNLTDSQGLSALTAAAQRGHTLVAKTLLMAGAHPQGQGKGVGPNNLLDASVPAPLLYSTMNGDMDLLQTLVDENIEYDKVKDGNGNTALMIAAINGPLSHHFDLLRHTATTLSCRRCRLHEIISRCQGQPQYKKYEWRDRL